MRSSVFQILKTADILPGGKADRKEPSDFPSGALRSGVSVELEHTKLRPLAREIAMDHLTEDPKYYEKLRTIHKEAGIKVQPKHQEFLDEHFGVSPAWKKFRAKLRSPSFVDAVKADTRSDKKLQRYSDGNGKHLQARGVPTFPVPSQSSGSKSYDVKYHSDIDRFTCNCGDWIHKRSWRQGQTTRDCKHIWLVKNELKNQGITPQDLTKQAAAGAAAARLLAALS